MSKVHATEFTKETESWTFGLTALIFRSRCSRIAKLRWPAMSTSKAAINFEAVLTRHDGWAGTHDRHPTKPFSVTVTLMRQQSDAQIAGNAVSPMK